MIYDEDIEALVDEKLANSQDRMKVISLLVVAGTLGPQAATLTLDLDACTDRAGDRQRPGRCRLQRIKAIVPHEAVLELYQVHAVTQGTDAQAEVSVRLQVGGQHLHGPRALTGHAGVLGQGLPLGPQQADGQAAAPPSPARHRRGGVSGTGMRIGVDLGGTKIEVLALGDRGEELLRRRVPTPRHDYDAIVASIADLVRGVEADLGEAGTVGVGIPGSISPATGLVKNANTTVLIGHPHDRDLGAALGREVRLENDANCFALSEAVRRRRGRRRHRLRPHRRHGGAGSGIVIDGKVLRGRHLIGGEFGHNPLPWPSVAEVEEAPACYCGQRGCLETWVSGTGFADDYRRATGLSVASPDIAAAAASGDPASRAAYERYVSRLARGLAPW